MSSSVSGVLELDLRGSNSPNPGVAVWFATSPIAFGIAATMAFRIRFDTLSLLLLMTLVAVCLGWAADRVRLQRERRQMAQWESIYDKRGDELTFAHGVNKELREENKNLRAKLRDN